MSMTDPIADFLTRIRNAHLSKHDRLDVPSSKLKLEICRILKEEGLIKNFRMVDAREDRACERGADEREQHRVTRQQRGSPEYDPAGDRHPQCPARQQRRCCSHAGRSCSVRVSTGGGLRQRQPACT